MNRTDLIIAVAQQRNIQDTVVDDVLGGFVDVVIKAMADDEEVAIRGFGKFEPRIRENASLRHAVNGDRIETGARRTMVFKPSMIVKDRLNTNPL